MLSFFATFVVATALVSAARYYSDFIARDPYNFDQGPAWHSKLLTILLLTSPFLLLSTGFHVRQTIPYNAALSLAVSTLIIPAVLANRTGEGSTWLANTVEKSVAATALAFVVSFLTTYISTIWWYGLLVVLGALSMWSRRPVLLLGVQDESRPERWNDTRVLAMKTYISRATAAYWVLALGLGSLVQHSYVGAHSWNTGTRQLWELLLKALGWYHGDA